MASVIENVVEVESPAWSVMLGEGEVRSFEQEEDYLTFLQERDARDKWLGQTDEESAGNNAFLTGIEPVPCENGELGLYVRDGELGGMPLHQMKELILDSGIGLTFKVPEGAAKVEYPIRPAAYAQLVAAAGFADSPVLLNTKARGLREPASFEDKAAILRLGLDTLPVTTAASKVGKRFKICIRDGAINAVLSGETGADGGKGGYTVLPFTKVNDLVKNVLLDEYGKADFTGGSVSHIYDFVDYEVDNLTLLVSLEQMFGVSAGKVKVKVRLSSSDCGASAVTVSPIVSVKGIDMLLGDQVKEIHRGDGGIARILSGAKLLFSSTQDTVKILNEWKNEIPANPEGMFLRVCKKVGLPKKEAFERVTLLEGFIGATVYDVWWLVEQFLSAYEEAGKFPLEKRLNLNEQLYRLVRGGFFEQSDYKFDWE